MFTFNVYRRKKCDNKFMVVEGQKAECPKCEKADVDQEAN